MEIEAGDVLYQATDENRKWRVTKVVGGRVYLQGWENSIRVYVHFFEWEIHQYFRKSIPAADTLAKQIEGGERMKRLISDFY